MPIVQCRGNFRSRWALPWLAGAFGALALGTMGVLSLGQAGAQSPVAAQALLEAETFALVGSFEGAQLASIAIGDFNGDGQADLALGEIGSVEPGETLNGLIHYIEGPVDLATGSETAMNAISTFMTFGGNGNFIAFALSAADLDGDGFEEVFYPLLGQEFFEWTPGASTLFADAAVGVFPPFAFGFLAGPADVFALSGGDLNGDGVADLTANDLTGGDATTGLVRSLLGPFTRGATEDESWSSSGIIASSFEDIGAAMAVGDVTGDGFPDVLFSEASSGAIRVVPGPLASSFALGTAPQFRLVQEGLEISSLSLGDVDLDGVADLVVGGFNADAGQAEFWVLPGPLGPSLDGSAIADLASEAYTHATGAVSVTRSGIGDVTGDGAPDLLLGVADLVALDPGRVSVLSGGERSPVITEIVPARAMAGETMEIRGRGFFGGDDLAVRLTASDGVATAQVGTPVGVEVEVLSLGAMAVTLPPDFALGTYDVTVETPAGVITSAGGLTVGLSTRTVTLARGWNLVGWTGATPVAEVAAAIVLTFGDGVWIDMSEGAIWEQPPIGG